MVGLFVWLTVLITPGESGLISADAADQRLTLVISTDKSVYRNGETLQWRGSVFAASSLEPLTTVQPLANAVFTVESPRGDSVSSTTISVSSVSDINGNLIIPADWAGGIYTIRVEYPGAPPTLRTFEIRAFNNPRISITVNFVKSGYGAEEDATAIITATRSEGGAAANAKLSATASVDGQSVPIDGLSTTLDGKGTGFVRVRLPSSIPGAGDGTLTVTVDDSGTVESKGQTIPILVQQLDVRIYPEGGALVYGVLNYVYVQAYTNQGDPADFTASLEMTTTTSTTTTSPSPSTSSSPVTSTPASPTSSTPTPTSFPVSTQAKAVNVVSLVNPSTATVKPVTSTVKPASSTVKPATTIKTATTVKPATSTVKPVTTVKPATSTVKLATSTVKLATATAKPAATTTKAPGKTATTTTAKPGVTVGGKAVGGIAANVIASNFPLLLPPILTPSTTSPSSSSSTATPNPKSVTLPGPSPTTPSTTATTRTTTTTTTTTATDVTFSTIHEGRGWFSFIPARNNTYALRVTKPHTVSLPIPIPDSLFSNAPLAATVHAEQTTYPSGSNISATLSVSSLGGSGQAVDFVYRVELARRDTVLATKLVYGRTSNQGVATQYVELFPQAAGTNKEVLPQGVLRLTLYRMLADGTSVPEAERLVFQEFSSEQTLNVAITSVAPSASASPDAVKMITSDLNSLTPGDWVELSVSVTNSVTGSPVSGLVGVSVTDLSAENIVDQRKRNPRLREMVLLEQEVVDLTDCDAYLPPLPGSSPLLPANFASAAVSYPLNTSSNGTALFALQSTALDLLLGTQGWRRFVFVNQTAKNLALDATDKAVQTAAQLLMGPTVALPTPSPPPVYYNRFMMPGMFAKGAVPELAMRGNFGAMPEMAMAMEAPAYMASPPMAMAMSAPAIVDKPTTAAQSTDQSAADVTREYATPPPGEVRQRVSFTDNIYWAAASTTDSNGQLKFKFQLSDAVTTFHVSVDVFGYSDTNQANTTLSLGRGDLMLYSKLPFYAEPKLPLQLTAGDHALVPVSIVSSLSTPVVVSTTVKIGSVVGTMPTAVDIGDTNPFTNKPLPPPTGIILKGLTIDRVNTTTINANSRSRALVGIKALQTPYYSSAIVSMNFVTVANPATKSSSSSASPATVLGSDVVTKSLPVFPRGFPRTLTKSGLLTIDPTSTTGTSAQYQFNQNFIAGSASIAIRLYPSPSSDLMTALESLIQEPCGCFEQTSATSYPLVMALRYFQTQPQTPLKLVQQASDILDRAYTRLVGFETPQRGYEWFGGVPAHEALTAYGLAQFLDMNGVYDVDQDMLTRTKDWLLSRRTTDGTGFQRNPQALDSFGRAPTLTTDAYIAWSLANSGMMNATSGADFSALVNRLEQEVGNSSDPYVIALVSGVLLKLPEPDRISQGRDLATRLVKYQATNGAVKGATISITGSQGNSLDIETTAISVLSWLEASFTDPQNNLNVEFRTSANQAMEWLLSMRSGGTFGSTQGTVLALKAIITLDKIKASEQVDMIASVEVDGQPAGDPVVFGPSTSTVTSDSNGLVGLPDVGRYLQQNTPAGQKAQSHTITLKIKPKNPVSPSSSSSSSNSTALFTLPYSISVSLNTANPPVSSNNSSMRMKLTAARSSLTTSSDPNMDSVNGTVTLSMNEGDGIQLSLEVTNTANAGQGMVVAVVGIPGGMELRSDQLAQLVSQKSIAFYETLRSGGQLVLYWRDFPPNGQKTVLIDLTATIPGDYVATPSSVYLYYNDVNKFFIPGIAAHIAPLS